MKFFKRVFSSLLSAGLLVGLALSITGCKTETDPVEPKEYSAVTELTSTAGYKQISLSWTNPDDDELSSIEVKYGTNANNLTEKKTCTSSENSCSFTGLANGTKYYFTVFAVYSDSNNTRKASSTAGCTTLTPAAVTGLKAEASGTTSIKISWTNQTGDFYTSKKLLYGTDSTSLDKSVEISDNTTTSYEITELAAETKYYVQVQTVLSDGDTVISGKVSATTEKETINVNEPTDDGTTTGLSSVEMAAAMTVGWNLGNTLDAPTETGWGLPKTTQTMIDAVRDAGFKTIRIPVSWSTHVDSSYNIDSTWMARVKEVVDYAYNDGLYVILNVHHDIYSDTTTDYKGNAVTCLSSSDVYGYAITTDSTLQTKSKAYLEKVWTQIATEFASYDNKLVFEVLNEPRHKDQSDEWYISSSSTAKTYCDVITDYENTCISAIRAVSGNENRFLMTPGYDASGTDQTMLGAYTMPTDTASDKLILSAHAYSPLNFAMSGTDTTFDSSDEASLTSIINYLKTNYTDKGIGVVMGEMSASNKDNTAERVKWMTDYCTKAKNASIAPVLWDNMVATADGNEDTNSYSTGYSGEHHGWLNRNTCSWYFPTVIQAMMDACEVTATVSGAAISIPEYVAPTVSSIGWDESATTNILTDAGTLTWGTSANKLTASNFTNAKKGSILKLTFAASGAAIKIINDSWSVCHEGQILNGTINNSEGDSQYVITAESTELYYVLTSSDATTFKSGNIYIAGQNGTVTGAYFQE